MNGKTKNFQNYYFLWWSLGFLNVDILWRFHTSSPFLIVWGFRIIRGDGEDLELWSFKLKIEEGEGGGY